MAETETTAQECRDAQAEVLEEAADWTRTVPRRFAADEIERRLRADAAALRAGAVAVFDAAPVPPECDPATVEAVVDALYDVRWPGGESLLHMARTHTRRLAAAAIAALPPSPAEEAVKRVEALLDDADARNERQSFRFFDGSKPDANVWVATVRAALASPAPAPHGEEGQR